MTVAPPGTGRSLESDGAGQSLSGTRDQRRPARMKDLLGRRAGPESEATAVNASGAVAGTASGRAFLWKEGRFLDLGPEPGGSHAYGINDAGTVVGDSWTLTERPAATVWDSGRLVRLPALPGEQASVAYDINSDGLVVGRSTDSATGRHRAVAWWGSKLIELVDLGGGSCEALAVNGSGVIVGSSATVDGQMHAVLWQDGRLQDLGTLGGARSVARAVNASGQVAGWSTTAEGRIHAFLWADGCMADLGTLGGSRSQAHGLSDLGQVVGWSTCPSSEEKRAFSWLDGTLLDLGTLHGTNSLANDVNAAGCVVGRASTGVGALGVAIRRGAWSWEAHAVMIHTGV